MSDKPAHGLADGGDQRVLSTYTAGTSSHGLRDSGLRDTSVTGMQKESSNGRGRFDLLSPIALKQLAIHTEHGALKYSERNWESGNKLSVAVNSALRHLNDYQMGDRSEPHLVACMWQMMCAIHWEHMIATGVLSKDFDDLPRYL